MKCCLNAKGTVHTSVPPNCVTAALLLLLVRQEKRRQTAIKVQRIRKQLGFPGAEDRKLSWDAMEQIR